MPVTVRFQNTPNPNAGKFTADRRVVEGKASRSYYGAAQAAEDAVAHALFGIEGVASVFMADDFVTVTKHADADWEALAPRVIATLERTLA
ncbi:MAG TPA: NifU N-terminal domain-containing protein [Longimicrobiales bacterium]|nr:NifU N-terminal domain-containing protein [Longimicrobiales bacterium]